MEKNLEQKFWSRVNSASKNECWLWTGETNNQGYGRLAFGSQSLKKRRRYMAHRLSYLIHTGADPGKMEVMHRCDNPLCVNPAHLTLGTHKDNIRDCHAKNRGNHGQKNGMAKFSNEEILRIKAMKDQCAEIVATQYGTTAHYVRRIWAGSRWSKVK